MATSAELLNQSKDHFKVALAGFRENYDLCTESGLFLKKTLLSMDTCAIDFRSLGFTEVTVANAVSKVWLDSVLHFYQNISRMEKKNIADLLDTLGRQAKQLGLAFKVIAEWSREVAGHLHQTCLDTQEEAHHFVRTFIQEVKDSARKLDEGNLFPYTISSICPATPVAIPVITKPHPEAEKNYEAAIEREKKAEVIANKAAKLVTTLHALHTTTESIAAFWTAEYDTFSSKGQKMRTNETDFNRMNLDKMFTKEDIKSWKKAKSDFGTYVDAMSSILNYFNYITDAHPSPTQELKLDSFDFVLSVPSTINVKEIIG